MLARPSTSTNNKVSDEAASLVSDLQPPFLPAHGSTCNVFYLLLSDGGDSQSIANEYPMRIEKEGIDKSCQ